MDSRRSTRKSRKSRRFGGYSNGGSSGYSDDYSRHFRDSYFSSRFWIPVILGFIIMWAANHFGVWYGTPIVGFLAGIYYTRTSRALSAGLLMGLLGWGGALLWQNLHYPITSAAAMISGVMGFGTTHGYIVIVLTLAVGILLSLASAWFGNALRALFTAKSFA